MTLTNRILKRQKTQLFLPIAIYKIWLAATVPAIQRLPLCIIFLCALSVETMKKFNSRLTKGFIYKHLI